MKKLLKNKYDVSLAIKQLEILKFDKGQKYKFECTRKQKRTLPQNSYYFGVVLKVLSLETGHSTEDLHEYFKAEYLKEHVKMIDVMGKWIVKDLSTTELDTKVFSDYIEKIRNFASSELSCYIPDANEVPDDLY